MPEKYSSQGYVDTLLLKGNRDIIAGFVILTIGTIIGFSNYKIGFWIGLAIGVYFLLSYYARANGGEQSYEMTIKTGSSPKKLGKIEAAISAPITDENTIADKIRAIHNALNYKCPSCGATVTPTDHRCGHCGSFLVTSANLPKPAIWSDIELGQKIHISHPKGETVESTVSYRIYHGELWQADMKPNVPWTLTGNYFIGLGLSKGSYLLNWQNRYYLLENTLPLSDNEINRDFARAAREFAASNQTKDVNLVYGKGVWKIVDIGRFRIEYTEGIENSVEPGAVGRFIHAKNRNDKQVLVLEDFQSGGSGLDNLRIGYELQGTDIDI